MDFRNDNAKVIPTSFVEEESNAACRKDSIELKQVKGELAGLETKISIQKSEIWEFETKISTSKQAIQGILEDRFQFSKKYYSTPSANNTVERSGQIVHDKFSNLIISGNIEGLIRELLAPSQKDMNYKLAFILSYRSFATPSRIISQLCEIFNNPQASNDIKKDICTLIECWVGSHYYDLDGDADFIRHLIAFVDSFQTAGFVNEASRIFTLLRNHMIMKLKIPKISYENSPQEVIPKNNLSFLDFDNLEVARQMCLLDQRLYCTIKPREFINRSWLVEDSDETESPNIIEMIGNYNRMICWVISMILKSNVRSQMLEKFIHIAYFCIENRNFNSGMFIINAIEDILLLHFDDTWEGVDETTLPLLSEIRKLTVKTNNMYENLKEKIAENRKACVPFLQSYLDEIIEIENDHPDFAEEGQLINFDKRRKIAKVIFEALSFQKQRYNFRPVHAIQNYLINAKGLSRDELNNVVLLSTLTSKNKI